MPRLAAIAGGVVLLTAVPLVPANAEDQATAPVQVQVGSQALQMVDGVAAPAVTSQIIGANGRWAGDEQGAWDSANSRPAAGFLDAAKAAKLKLVRYPGGTIANFFNFADAIGPVGQRKCQTSGGYAAPSFANLAPD